MKCVSVCVGWRAPSPTSQYSSYNVLSFQPLNALTYKHTARGTQHRTNNKGAGTGTGTCTGTALSSRDLPVGVSVPVFSLLFSSRRCARRRAQRTYSRRPLKDWCSLIESNRPKSAPEEDMVALCVLGCWGVRYWGVGGVAEERGRRARDGIGWIETEKRRGGSEERMMMCPSVRRGTREEWS